MGAALPVAAMAAQVAGPIVEGIGANKELRAAARVDDENARLSILSGERDVADTMRDERQVAGDALAELGGSGLLVGGGSAAELIRESARQRNKAIATRREQARGEQKNYQQAARDKRRAGKHALIAGAFGAASAALSGANKMSNQNRVDAQLRSERGVRLGGAGG